MILECVPNISEGRNPKIIDQIVDSMKNVDIKNVHMDPDHNRSVITFFGEQDQTVQAAYSMAKKAVELIDIRKHEGVHPFIGVVDVIPFVPNSDASMRYAICAAHELGEKLWKELELPIYYYGEAAIAKEKSDLPDLRKGVGMRERKPDVGSGVNLTAGASAIGARKGLIAFNVNLDTDDLSVAQSIAKSIREKNGGLPGVRALGFELKSKGVTQVSINIVDHEKTSLEAVYREVEKQAEQLNAKIIESELVGMLPASLYKDGMEKEIKISNFSKSLLWDN